MKHSAAPVRSPRSIDAPALATVRRMPSASLGGGISASSNESNVGSYNAKAWMRWGCNTAATTPPRHHRNGLPWQRNHPHEQKPVRAVQLRLLERRGVQPATEGLCPHRSNRWQAQGSGVPVFPSARAIGWNCSRLNGRRQRPVQSRLRGRKVAGPAYTLSNISSLLSGR